MQANDKISVQVWAGTELTIRRPDGSVEVVRNDKLGKINDVVFAKVRAATKAAGRGDVLSYRNLTKDAAYTVTQADVDTDTAARIERTMAAGEVSA